MPVLNVVAGPVTRAQAGRLKAGPRGHRGSGVKGGPCAGRRVAMRSTLDAGGVAPGAHVPPT